MAQKRARKVRLFERSLRCAKRNQHSFRLSGPGTSHAPSISLAENDEKQARHRLNFGKASLWAYSDSLSQGSN